VWLWFGLRFVLRLVPAASMLPEAMRLLLLLRARVERGLQLLPVRRLQR
jgi:hypothetical protein